MRVTTSSKRFWEKARTQRRLAAPQWSGCWSRTARAMVSASDNWPARWCWRAGWRACWAVNSDMERRTESAAQLGADRSNDRVPIPGRRLTEKAHRGIPRGGRTIQAPAPVGDLGDQVPDALAERGGEVGEGGIDRDDEVELRDVRGG